jgi:hypothetical protein
VSDTTINTQVQQLCEKYGLEPDSVQSLLLTLVHQLRHNNTIGYSLEDIINRFDVLLGHAQASGRRRQFPTQELQARAALPHAALPPKPATPPSYVAPLIMPIDENTL